MRFNYEISLQYILNAIPSTRKYTVLKQNGFLKRPKHEIIKTDYLIS